MKEKCQNIDFFFFLYDIQMDNMVHVSHQFHSLQCGVEVVCSQSCHKVRVAL